MTPEIVVAIALIAGPSRPSCRTADERLEQAIASKRAELKGVEHCQYRLYDELSDLDGDKVEDFLVVFTIEGLGGTGNDSRQFLAVFPSGRSWQASVAEVGRRGKRVVGSIEVGGGGIRLSTLEYAPSDAMCCPTRHGQLWVRLEKGRLAFVRK